MRFLTTVTLTEAQWNSMMRIMRNWGSAKSLSLAECISLILQTGIETEIKNQEAIGILEEEDEEAAGQQQVAEAYSSY